MAIHTKNDRTPTWATRRGRRRVRRLIWVASIVLLLGGGITYLAWTYGWAGGVTEGEPAPAFVLQDADGHSVNLADYLGRKPVLLVFYMTYT